MGTLREIQDAQRRHWERTLAEAPSLFGDRPSSAARAALAEFKSRTFKNLLELGAGHGRDALFFARRGFRVTALEYAGKGLDLIASRARDAGLSDLVIPICHDIREPLPFEAASFDACYSHMLYCMALTEGDLEALSGEVRRILKPGGLNIYTVRHTGDPQYATGTRLEEKMYEIEGGFVVHFFDRELVGRLSKGFEILGIEEFEEGGLPRRLFRVTLKKES